MATVMHLAGSWHWPRMPQSLPALLVLLLMQPSGAARLASWDMLLLAQPFVAAEEIATGSAGVDVLDLLGVADQATRVRIGEQAEADQRNAAARRNRQGEWGVAQPEAAGSLAVGEYQQAEADTAKPSRQGQLPAQPPPPPSPPPPFDWLGQHRTGGDGIDLREPKQSVCNIQRIPASEFTRERFVREFQGREPFILTGATNGWDAHRWDYATLTANASHNAKRLKAAANSAEDSTVGLADAFANSLAHTFAAGTEQQRRQRLIVDGHALTSPTLRAGYQVPEWASRAATEPHTGLPNFIGPWREHVSEYIHNLSVVMQRDLQPSPPATAGERYFIIGPAGSGGRPHIDVDNQSFWNALVQGRKRWFLMSLAVLKKLVRCIPYRTH